MKTLVSSMNLKLYQSYGKNFVDSWEAMADNDVRLVIFFEGNNNDIPKISSEQICIIPIESEIQAKFLSKFSNFTQANGIQLVKLEKFPGLAKYSYNFRYDAIRFSFKIFSLYKYIQSSLFTSNFGWIDSDIVCLRKFSSEDLDEFFPEAHQIASYLGRDSFPKPNSYSECGFIGYNYNNPDCAKFIHTMLEMYMSGDIFMQKEWHDSFIFDVVRKDFETEGKTFKNISSKFMGEEHPFMKTNLGTYFDHLKGPERKLRGHS